MKSKNSQEKVALLGSRGVGKTTLVKMIGADNCCYYSFDDIDLQATLRKFLKYLEVGMGPSK